MRIMYPDLIDTVEIIDSNVIGIVIENQQLMSGFIQDLYSQVNGFDGKTVLSEDNKPIEIAKNLEVINEYFNFDINKKTIVNKIIKRISETVLAGESYGDTMLFLGNIEQKLYNWGFEVPGDIIFNSITPEILLKAAGLGINNDYSSLNEIAEKLLDYMELVKEYDRKKVFVFVNMRSFFSDKIMQQFINSCISHNHSVILVDNKDNPVLKKENRIIIDVDLCKF